MHRSELIKDFSEVQKASIKCSMPLFIPVRKVFVVMWSLSLFLILLSVTAMAMRYDVLATIMR